MALVVLSLKGLNRSLHVFQLIHHAIHYRPRRWIVSHAHLSWRSFLFWHAVGCLEILVLTLRWHNLWSDAIHALSVVKVNVLTHNSIEFSSEMIPLVHQTVHLFHDVRIFHEFLIVEHHIALVSHRRVLVELMGAFVVVSSTKYRRTSATIEERNGLHRLQIAILAMLVTVETLCLDLFNTRSVSIYIVDVVVLTEVLLRRGSTRAIIHRVGVGGKIGGTKKARCRYPVAVRSRYGTSTGSCQFIPIWSSGHQLQRR
mmetsp:Transcript_21279/g.52724  ORF Transcript_21279/g.52724 Transcript_21279/m.52724 type:complete len:257 (-) Transcript_21279:171-941(-)